MTVWRQESERTETGCKGAQGTLDVPLAALPLQLWALRRLLLGLLLLVPLLGQPALAQPPPEAMELVRQAEGVIRQARERYDAHTPDQPLWAQAIDLASRALAMAPDDPELVRFMARTYSYVNWYVRAWDLWLRYLAMGGSLDDPPEMAEDELSSRELFARVGTELGFARYQAGNKDGAVPYYETVLEYLPDNAEALRWLGRIHFEQGRSEAALPYWQRLTELLPDDDGAAYYLGLTRERIAVGVAASDAFQRGIVAYEAGDLSSALSAFEEALAQNGAFTQAAVWAGRTSLELGQPAKARDYWRRVLELSPGDARANYFLEVSEAQLSWGIEAANAFYLGQARYQQGDLDGAAEAFMAAVEANGDYLDAWVWAARTLQEAGRPADAIRYWQGVLARDPNDSRAQYFLQVAEQQREHGVVAGRAFMEAVSRYQQAQFAEAEQLFKQAVDANPDFAEAWGWLGRLYFDQANYAEAARHYQRAHELEPDNDDYAFFAEEARLLAGE